MSDYVYAPKQDANHGQIVAAYERLYCKVLDLHKVGGGCPDTLVRIPTKRGQVLELVEIKVGDAPLKSSQVTFSRDWMFRVVRTEKEVFDHVEEVRARK